MRTYAQQKAALTRAQKKGYDAVLAECTRAVGEWNSREAPFTYGWPDAWSRWQRALDDAHPTVFGAPRLEDLT